MFDFSVKSSSTSHFFRLRNLQTAINQVCQDINECTDSKCPDSSTCKNTIGSFDCNCKDGFALSGDRCVDIEQGLTSTNFCQRSCHNLVKDECWEQSHKCTEIVDTAKCQNSLGTYFCECPPGSRLNISTRPLFHETKVQPS